MPNLPIESCPRCRHNLVGVVEVSSAKVGELNVVVMSETRDRNWITCDGCNETVCKSCCVMPDSGYCDSCFFKCKIEPYLPEV